MEKDSKWRSKDDTGLKIYIKKGSRGFEKGTIMIKDPEKWYDWQIRALYIMYPDHKDVMLVLVKKHLADWGIPSSPLERSDMRNKEEVAIAWLIMILMVVPLVILYPPVLMIGIIGYCAYVLYDHYIGSRGI